MDFYGSYFEYAGELSRKYGLIIACINTQRNALLTGKSQSVSIFNKRNHTRYSVGSVYSEAPLTFDMEVVSEEPIEGEWRRKIQKWLFHQRDYQKLYIENNEVCFGEVFAPVNGRPKRMYLNCRFVNPEIIEGDGGIIGYKFSVECDSRMAWQDPISIKTECDGGAGFVGELCVEVDTDSEEYTYPVVTVRIGDIGGDVCLTNKSDDINRCTKFAGIDPGVELVINSAFNYVSGNNYEHFTDRHFPRLLDGENMILISGDIVSIEIKWQNMRYL